MPIKINGATSGSTTITAPATGSDESIELSTALASKGDISTNGAWTSYTPTFTNVTVGNGTLTAGYLQIGKLVHVYARLIFGSTTTLSGDVSMTLPVNRSAASRPYLDTIQFLDSGTALISGITNITTAAGVDKINIRARQVSGTVIAGLTLGATFPFTWTTNDEMLIAVAYEGV